MLRPFKMVMVLAMGTVLVSAPAFAAESTPRVDKRQENQKARVHQGVHSGELTRHEAHHLVDGQRHINRMEKRATADGTVTGKERLRIEHAQDRQSGRIYGLKHNDRDRN